ncbi:hypothetical protein E4K72_10475 [Oxalobacteraceae bacterium OM1]|nr:hypothetical protein E4K72_10475 [Oxalobacteraceae bacterium OM1]
MAVRRCKDVMCEKFRAAHYSVIQQKSYNDPTYVEVGNKLGGPDSVFTPYRKRLSPPMPTLQMAGVEPLIGKSTLQRSAADLSTNAARVGRQL